MVWKYTILFIDMRYAIMSSYFSTTEGNEAKWAVNDSRV